jgi:aminopeptidase N
MAGYFARHAWGNTTLQDLIDSLSEASGRDLDTWRTAWLATAGTDRFSLERDGDSVTLVAAGSPRPQVLAVGAYARNGDALERRALVRVEVTEPRTAVTGLPPAADVLLINDDDLTFATTRPDPTTRDALFRTAAQLPTAISRGVAAATVWDMLTTGEATAAEAGRCLTSVLAAETSDAVIEPYLTLAANIAELWAPPADRVALSAEVAAACRSLAADPGRRQVALRGLARTATTADDLGWLRQQAGDDVDLHWRALIREAELGGDVTAESDLLLTLDPDPDAWLRALTVRAALPDAATKAEVWQQMAVDRTVPVNSVGLVAAAFWCPGQDTLLAPYAERYLEALPKLHQGGMILAMSYTRRLFPLHAIDATYIERARHASQEAVPVVRTTLLERSDEVSRMLRARGGSV